MNDPQDPIPFDKNPETLRDELVRVRSEAEQELERLREEIDVTQGLADQERDIDSVTENVALQQELDTLRSALQEKERVVDDTALQCRRLEDELEDKHLAFDGLKHELDRSKAALRLAREQAIRLRDERQSLEEQYQVLREDPESPPDSGMDLVDIDRALTPQPTMTAGRLFAGLLVGLALAGIAGVVWLRPDLFPFLSLAPETAGQIATAPEVGAPQDVPAEPTAAPVIADAGEEPGVEQQDEAPAVVPRTVQDRLKNGASGPLMVAVPPGVFKMGKLRALPNDNAGPAHEVRVNGFLIGAREVTFDDYDRFVRATGGRFPNDFGWGRGQRPVVDVSWSDARAYAQWLSRQTGKRYRLPSEAEWEYAARGGKSSAYWWGYGLETGRAVCFDCGTAWDNRSTAPSGSFDPNPFGLHDTAGNAMEWVEDCYHPNYVGAPGDTMPWVNGDCRYRAARGGAFNKPARSMRSTARHRFVPTTRMNMLGFRIARDE